MNLGSYRCANSKNHSIETKEKLRRSNSITSKLLWQDPIYRDKMKDALNNKYFTSKAEVKMRDHFINNFNDDWTFGGGLSCSGLTVSRDLYSKKLKVCVEYDGVWHFKDIHGQLKKKQIKDKALEEWCIEKGWRLIRISESFHKEHKDDFVYIIEDAVYNKQDQVIKFGNEYCLTE